MAAIETNGLTKQFGESIVAVDDLDITVEEGEVYGFLGPNGAGKSTTINLLLNYLHPTAGEARILGHDTARDSLALRERVGILPEGAKPYDRLSAREHLELTMEIKGVYDDPDEILARVGLSQGDATRYVEEYSKGMVQRLGLGMALVGDPDVLILDEPSSGLDPTGMKEMAGADSGGGVRRDRGVLFKSYSRRGRGLSVTVSVFSTTVVWSRSTRSTAFGRQPANRPNSTSSHPISRRAWSKP